MAFPNITPLRKRKVNQINWNTVHDMRVDFCRMDHEMSKLRAEVTEIKNKMDQIVEQKIDKIMNMFSDLLAKPSPNTAGTDVNDDINEIPLCPSVSSFLRDDLSSTSNEDGDKIEIPRCPSVSSFLRDDLSSTSNGDGDIKVIPRCPSVSSFLRDKLSSTRNKHVIDDSQRNENRQSSNWWELDAESKVNGEKKTKGLRPKRLSNGDFEFDITNTRPSSPLTAQEKRVCADWSHVILPSQVYRYGLANEKKIRFSTNLRLYQVDENVLGILYHFQLELIRSMIPYELWPMQLVSIMNDDLLQIADWARDSDLTWLDLVEAIIQTLKKQGEWPDLESSFENIGIRDETDALGIFLQVRRVFYHLPNHFRSSALIRKGLIQKMRHHIPWSFLFFNKKLGIISTGNLIEEVIRLLKMPKETIIYFNTT